MVYINRSMASRSQEVILLLNPALVRPSLEYCIHFWGPQPQGMELLQVSRRATTLIKDKRLENFCKDRLRKLGLKSLERRRLQGDLVATFQYLKETTAKPERDPLSGDRIL